MAALDPFFAEAGGRALGVLDEHDVDDLAHVDSCWKLHGVEGGERRDKVENVILPIYSALKPARAGLSSQTAARQASQYCEKHLHAYASDGRCWCSEISVTASCL